MSDVALSIMMYWIAQRLGDDPPSLETLERSLKLLEEIKALSPSLYQKMILSGSA